MSVSFSASELINIAIGIEKQGIAYYDVMADSTWHEVARDLFRHLRDMERSHVEIFQGMLKDVEQYEAPKEFGPEYNAYLQALVENAVFTDEMAAGELATHLDNENEAMDIAISAEKESILFYYFMSEVTVAAAVPIVQKILAEEKNHLRQLSEIKKRLIDLK
jgi:rubrerythrin